MKSYEEIENTLKEIQDTILKEFNQDTDESFIEELYEKHSADNSFKYDLSDIKRIVKNFKADITFDIKEMFYLTKQALKARAEHRYNDCVELLEMVIERFPGIPEIKVHLAQAYEDADNFGKAIKIWEELYKSDKRNCSYSYELAEAYRVRGWYRKAIRQYELTLALNPHIISAWEGIVECHRDADEEHEALRYCIEAISFLKNNNMESPRLYTNAFDMWLRHKNKTAAIENIAALVEYIEKNNTFYDYFNDLFIDIIDAISEIGAYEFLVYARTIINLLPDIDNNLIQELKELEFIRDMEGLIDDYPTLFGSLLFNLANEHNSEDQKLDIVAMECSILADIEGYLPFITRLAKEYPNLYSIHSEFFNLISLQVGCDKMLSDRFDYLFNNDMEPILRRADGTEIKSYSNNISYKREGRKIGRNEPCPCASGKKYKKCCGI